MRWQSRLSGRRRKGVRSRARLTERIAGSGDRAQHLGRALGEGRALRLERAVLVVEADALEPAVEGALRRAHHGAVDALLARPTRARRRRRRRSGPRVLDARRRPPRRPRGTPAARAQRSSTLEGAQHELAQVEGRHAHARVLLELLVGTKRIATCAKTATSSAARSSAASLSSSRSRSSAPSSVRGSAREQAQHQVLAVAASGLRREAARVRPEVFELQVELGRVVALRVERERLGEDALEAVAGVALEAHLARVERVGEAEGRASRSIRSRCAGAGGATQTLRSQGVRELRAHRTFLRGGHCPTSLARLARGRISMRPCVRGRAASGSLRTRSSSPRAARARVRVRAAAAGRPARLATRMRSRSSCASGKSSRASASSTASQ